MDETVNPYVEPSLGWTVRNCGKGRLHQPRRPRCSEGARAQRESRHHQDSRDRARQHPILRHGAAVSPAGTPLLSIVTRARTHSLFPRRFVAGDDPKSHRFQLGERRSQSRFEEPISQSRGRERFLSIGVRRDRWSPRPGLDRPPLSAKKGLLREERGGCRMADRRCSETHGGSRVDGKTVTVGITPTSLPVPQTRRKDVVFLELPSPGRKLALRAELRGRGVSQGRQRRFTRRASRGRSRRFNGES